MPARPLKKTEPTIRSPAAHRRNGRPRTATAASRIYSDLRAELVSLRRLPGEAVSEAEIALSYGVSRTPVREAILRLSDEGLLEIFPQSGIIVSRIPVAALPEAIIIRKALEETTARLAAERATSSQILGAALDPGTPARGQRGQGRGRLPPGGRNVSCGHRRCRRISRNLEAHLAGEGECRSLSPLDPAAIRADHPGDCRA